MENALIDKNWKSLIKPSKLNFKTSDDKSSTTVTAEPFLDAGPVELIKFAADEPAAALKDEVKVVADAILEE